MKISIRVLSLYWAGMTVLFALFEMQDYLTEVWGLSFTHAAGILNIWNGISLLLQPLFLFLVRKFLGNFRMLVISSSAYTLGIWFLFMSAPPILANSTNTCKQYEKECIGGTQKALLYTGMALIAVGVAGSSVSLIPFMNEQQDDIDKYGIVTGTLKAQGMMVVLMAGLALSIGLPSIKPWTNMLGITAGCSLIATISFLTGLCCYSYTILGPKGSQVPNFSRMLTLRICLTFIVFGIVFAIQNTYFVVQAKHLDRHIGKWNLPPQLLLLAQTWSSRLVALEFGLLVTKPGRGILMAKILAVLCCITAAKVEMRRLDVVRSHGLLDSPDEDVPMSVYWLLFQFTMFGGIEKLLEKNVVEFHEEEAIEEPEEHCLQILIKGVTGIGYMCGVLSVYVVGRVSEKGDKPSWFQFTLNRSHLDRYYWVLAVLSSASLLVFVVVRFCSTCRKPKLILEV